MLLLKAVLQAPHQQGHELHHLGMLVAKNSHIAFVGSLLSLSIPLFLSLGRLLIVACLNTGFLLDLLTRLSEFDDSEFPDVDSDFAHCRHAILFAQG